ncbi:hypothetical protein PoB_006832400 [Plakobranchus ocellatus]|uniref:Stereocilin LRR domain-containing protein n=1 Tax=Plakobranchus ocellatus TaxID=259542 RepID=A0AAV4DCC6_9GAST|nr:hypothetical protein PoB_006832400 [Plakobranchus ocellatus]
MIKLSTSQSCIERKKEYLKKRTTLNFRLQANNHLPGHGGKQGPVMTPQMINIKLRELLEFRAHERHSYDVNLNLMTLFGQLEELADDIHENVEIDPLIFELPANHATRKKAKAMECLNTPHQFRHFLSHVRTVLHELKDEYMDDLESEDVDTSTAVVNTNSHDHNDDHNDDHDHWDHDDTTIGGSSSQHTDETSTHMQNMHSFGDGTRMRRRNDAGSDEDTTDSAMHSTGDALGDSPADGPDTPGDSDDSGSDNLRRKRDIDIEGFFDLGEVLDRLDEDDFECLTSLMSQGEEKYLCHRFAHGSSNVFKMLMSVELECQDYLLEDDSDDDDSNRLDASIQRTILNNFKRKPAEEIDEDEIRQIMQLAPDVIDDSFLEGLPETIFQSNIGEIGRLASRRSGNPRLRYAFREKMDNMDLDDLSADDIMNIGPGLRALRLDQIDRLNASLLMNVHSAVIFEDDNAEDEDSDDDDDDDDDDVRLALGRRVKHYMINSGTPTNHSLTRALPFLYDDFDFVNSVDPEDLLESLNEMKDMDFDADDASSMMSRLAMSTRFPLPSVMTGQDLSRLGNLAKGMGVVQLGQLKREAIEEALSTLKDIDFDETQAEEILDELLDDTSELTIDGNLLQNLGKLIRGMSSEHLSMIRPDVIELFLDYLDDLDLNDVQKRAIVAKARHHGMLPPKFLELDDFADVMSIDELDDFGESKLHSFLNVSSQVHWRLPQRAFLAHMYKMSNGAARLRASDLNAMGQVVIGLLPSDLDTMVQEQDDVFDLAEELEDLQDELTSGQIDLLVTKFHDFGDLDNKEVLIDEAKAMQGAHFLAFLKQEHFEKLDFTHEGKSAFVSRVAKMKTHKMSRTHLQFLSRILLDMIEDTIPTKSEYSSDDRQAKRLRCLGSMALGLTPSQIRGFTGNAIMDNADLLRTLPLSKAQSKAILDKVDNSVQDWKCRADMLARLGPLLQHLDTPFKEGCDDEIRSSMSAIAKGLEKRRKMVEERSKAGFAREFSDATDDQGEKRVVNAMLTAAVAVKQNQGLRPTMERRARRAAVANGPLTCDALMHLQSTANMLEPQHLITMREAEFSNCFAMLGAISDWSDEALAALVDKAKSVYGGVETWTNELVRRAGSVVAGLSPAEIQQLHLDRVDAMHSIGKHGKLSMEQLKAGFRRWQSLSGNTNAANISSEDFSSLAEFVCGLEIADIHQLHQTTFKRSLHVIGKATKCSPEQRKAYLGKVMTVYGSNVPAWTPALISEMGHLLGAMGADHVRKLRTQQIALVDPEVVHNFQTDGLMAMTPTQLRAFSPNQANAVPQAVYETMTADQMSALDARASLLFIKGDSGTDTGGGEGDHDGETQ